MGDAAAPLSRRDGRPDGVEPGAVLAFMAVRDEAARLPYCLDYHRRLGVSRFFVVDNGSSDGTADYLLGREDVRLWSAEGSYADSGFGVAWLRPLLDVYGDGHWCLIVDADELLVYRDSETRGLPELCADLDREGARAFAAVLLDMYSDRPVRETVYEPGRDFLEACPFFDRQVFHHREPRYLGREHPAGVFGGARRRVFGAPGAGAAADVFYTLNKVPLVRHAAGDSLDGMPHWTALKPAPETGALLHFKFFSDFVGRVAVEAARGEHWDGGAQYRAYAAALRERPDLTLYAPEASERYAGTARLAALGVFGVFGGEGSERDWSKDLVRQAREMIRARRDRGAAGDPHEAGIALAKAGRLDEAAAAFRRAAAERPEAPWAWHNLGDVLAKLARWREAEAAFRLAVEHNPRSARSHVGLGDALLELGRGAEAAGAFREALRLQPELQPAARGLARALASDPATAGEAGRWYARAHALDPADEAVYAEVLGLGTAEADLFGALGDSLSGSGRRARAVAFYRRALEVRPDDAGTLAKLGLALAATGDAAGAAERLEEAARAAPGRADVRRQLAAALEACGRVGEAIEALREAAALEPEHAGTRKRLGDLLAHGGDVEAAALEYAEAIRLGYRVY